jgi:hypothetical protein
VGCQSPPPAGRFSPGKETRYPLYRRPSGPQGRSGRLRKLSPTPGFDPRTVQPLASRYTEYAVLTHRVKLVSACCSNESECKFFAKIRPVEVARYAMRADELPEMSFYASALRTHLKMKTVLEVIKIWP